MNSIIDTAIIGGGPAGLTAAISASGKGKNVKIFEKGDRTGKKLLMTGNSQCNFLNSNSNPDYFHSNQPDFCQSALNQFPVSYILNFFENMGIVPIIDSDGRYFPRSRQAGSILDALRFKCTELDCTIELDASVTDIQKRNGIFHIKTARSEHMAKTVILATGGKTYTKTGSDGSGYKLAEKLGHSLTDLFPTLVQLNLEGSLHKAMEGLKWEGSVSSIILNKKTRTVPGDILFTSYGLSGLAVLKNSRSLSQAVHSGTKPFISLDLLPEHPKDELFSLLKSRAAMLHSRKLEEFLSGWIHKRIGQTVIKSAGLSLQQSVSELNHSQFLTIAETLKDWRFTVTGTTGWQNAQVTAGGIKTSEINPKTLESKFLPGLFFAGEILDVDGDSGGYNLHWAWASGLTAGKSSIVI